MTKNSYIREWDEILERVGSKTLISNNIFKVEIMSTDFESQYFLYAIMLKDFDQDLNLQSFNLENLIITTENKDTIVLVLKNKDLIDVFFSLSFEIHSSIEKELNSTNVLNKITEIILKYVYLFKKKSPNKISKVVGLYGELVFINEALDSGLNNIISNWFGSDGKRHDFSFEKTSVEIKSSYLKKSIVTISSAIQLMVEPPENLYLSYYFFDVKNDSSLDSIHDIIILILSKLSNTDKYEFIRKLCEVEINFDENWKLPEPYKIELLIEKSFHVSESFPKLTPKNIPLGINSVKYEITLSSINNECEITKDNLWKHLN